MDTAKYTPGDCTACVCRAGESCDIFRHGVVGDPLCERHRDAYIHRLRTFAEAAAHRPIARAVHPTTTH